MCALALPAEQAEELDGLAPDAAEPVRYAGVELGRLAGREHQILLAEHEPQPPVQDVEPFVALVDLGLGFLGALTGGTPWALAKGSSSSRFGRRRPDSSRDRVLTEMPVTAESSASVVSRC